MSLKALHVFLITVATLTLLGFSAWCFQQRGGPAGFPGDLAIAGGRIAEIGKVASRGNQDGIYFLKKLKNVSYL